MLLQSHYYYAAFHSTMRPIVTDVAWPVCLLDTTVSPAKTVEPIEMPLRLRTRVGPMNNESCMFRFPSRGISNFGSTAPCNALFRQNSLTTANCLYTTAWCKASQWTVLPVRRSRDLDFKAYKLWTCTYCRTVVDNDDDNADKEVKKLKKRPYVDEKSSRFK